MAVVRRIDVLARREHVPADVRKHTLKYRGKHDRKRDNVDSRGILERMRQLFGDATARYPI